MWVVVRQDDWVGGEDVLGVVGSFSTEAEGRAWLEDVERRLPAKPHPRERWWLMPVELAVIAAEGTAVHAQTAVLRAGRPASAPGPSLRP